MTNLRIHMLKSPFGPIGLVWTGTDSRPLVRRVILSRPGQTADRTVSALFPGCPEDASKGILDLARGIEAFLLGGDVVFPLHRIDIESCPPFQQAVLRAEHSIPRGSVSTYSRIAGHLDRPGAARAVGNALARNPFPILVPCHRAIRSDGFPGDFQGGPAMKRRFLEMEGIVFDSAGRASKAGLWY
jgi:methylated-DNA-[protein]-cysteine S-methyltransferase